MVGEGEAGGAESDHQNLVAGGGPHDRALKVEGVPAGEQGVDFKAPGKFKYIFKGTGLNLWNINRFLFLEDAGFHAVITDAVAGAGDHGVINCDDGEGSDGVALLLNCVHLGDLFFERAAGQFDAEDAGFKRSVFLVQSGGAAVFALVVAFDAVVGLVEGTGEVGSGVSKLEAFAVAPVIA